MASRRAPKYFSGRVVKPNQRFHAALRTRAGVKYALASPVYAGISHLVIGQYDLIWEGILRLAPRDSADALSERHYAALVRRPIHCAVSMKRVIQQHRRVNGALASRYLMV